jgi:hypothetical protein
VLNIRDHNADATRDDPPFEISAVYFDNDKMQLWRKRQIEGKDLKWLRRRVKENGGTLDIYPDDYGNRADPEHIFAQYAQRVQMSRPPIDVLEWLAKSDDGDLFNRTERVIEIVTTNEQQFGKGITYIDRRLVKRWHKGEVHYEGTKGDVSRYTDGPTSPTNILTYNRSSKVTGEDYTIRIEFKAANKQGMKTKFMGRIDSINDLINQNNKQWAIDNLILKEVDMRQVTKVIRKKGIDIALVGCIRRWTAQDFIDRMKKHRWTSYEINKCLKNIDNQWIFDHVDGN